MGPSAGPRESRRGRLQATLIALGAGTSVVLALLALARPSGPAAGQPANPSLARVEVDIWPEFDQASQALVIIDGEIAPDATLPAAVEFRIPASSGGPTAVAGKTAADAPFQDLQYQRADTPPGSITLTFTVPSRFFRVEFYDALNTSTAARNYTYAWPGGFAAGDFVVQVQEPAGASGLTVNPDLGGPTSGPDGLSYRQASLGAVEGGKTLTVGVQYEKSDSRTTVEILGLNQPQPSTGGGSSTWKTVGIALAIVAGIVAGGLAVFGGVMLGRRLRPAPGRMSREERRRAAIERGPVCKRCGEPLRPDDRFCPVCGRTVHVKRED